MRILQVIHDFLITCRAGSEFYTYYLSKELSKKHDATLFFTIPEDGNKGKIVQGNYDGIPYYALKKNYIPYFDHPYQERNRRVEKEFLKVIEQFKPDLVHFQHLLNLSLKLPSLAKRRGIPACFTLHDYWLICPRIIFLTPDQKICHDNSPRQCLHCLQGESRHYPTQDNMYKKKAAAFLSLALWRNYWIKKVFKDIDIFITPSQFLLEKFVHHGLNRKKIVFIRHGFNKNVFRGMRRKKSSKVRFGFVGTISSHKGIYLLIDAFNKVKGYAELKIYGKVQMRVLDDIKKRILNPNIHIMGELKEEDKKNAFAEIDALIVPSIWYENYPLTINEAFLAKIPVITTDIGGMSELVKDGESGLTFPVGNVEKLTEKIEMYINNQKLRDHLSYNLPEVKDIETNAEELLKLYHQLKEGELKTLFRV